MVHTAPAASLFYIIQRLAKKLGIYSEWRSEIFLVVIFLLFIGKGNDCSAPLELAQRTSRRCEDFFVRRWQLLLLLPINKRRRWDTLKGFHMMREGQILLKSPCLSIL
jgi:hypothetical protein